MTTRTEFGYQENEYLFEGTAKTYPPSTLPPAPYRSRMIVWTPTDPARFNGTTVVEWAEVSDFGQFELTVELNDVSPMLEEEGYAFAVVSAEEGGVCDRSPDGVHADVAAGRRSRPLRLARSSGRPVQLRHLQPGAAGDQAPDGPCAARRAHDRHRHRKRVPAVDRQVVPGRRTRSRLVITPFGIYGPLNEYLANGADDDARLADAFLIDAAAPVVEPAEYRVPVLHHLDESAIRRTPTENTTNHVTWEIVGAPHADRWSGGHIVIPIDRRHRHRNSDGPTSWRP